MALAQSRADTYADPAPRSAVTLASVKASNSMNSIISLGDIPYVESSFDLEFDTIISGHNNMTASYFSTPRCTRPPSRSSKAPSLTSPWTTDSAKNLFSREYQNVSPKKDDQEISVEFDRNASVFSDKEQLRMLEEVSRAGGAVASMNDYISTWAPTAHYVVIAAAALQRDSAALASALTGILSSDRLIEPSSFANHYYQLREAYSSLLSLGDFSTVVYGQQGWTRASTKEGAYGKPVKTNDIEATWDDRQLLDSFVTLLRTAPGFISSAIMHMSVCEITSFLSEADGSPLNILFYGVLGSAKRNRPRLLAEIFSHMHNDYTKQTLIVQAILSRFLGLAIGTFSDSTCTKLERFILALLSRSIELPDFESIMVACIPTEFVLFIQNISDDSWEFAKEHCSDTLCKFACQLVAYPHRFGILNETYISEAQRNLLESFASNANSQIDILVSGLRAKKNTTQSTSDLWQPQELITLKGSDIIQMYNSLLPSRKAHSPLNDTVEDDEWCLDSIRADLIPVMQGLSHTTNNRADGWQIFRIGEDGLLTDLDSDMGLKTPRMENVGTRTQLLALCDAVAHYDGNSVVERINAARKDAMLRGDHCTLFNLMDAEAKISRLHVDTMKEHVSVLKAKCQSLRDTLDQAAKEQRKERERLSKLLSILDYARIHVWYEFEVRTSTPYHKASEFLHVLFPNCKSEDDEMISEKPTNGDIYFPGSSTSTSSGGARSRRLSILSSHSVPESPFLCAKEISPKLKLTDKEVDTTLLFMRRNRVRNVIPAEERFHRALVEMGNLARKLLDRDHLASYLIFKRDRLYKTTYNQQHAQNNSRNFTSRNSQHRRSSLGLFDFFDNNSIQEVPLTLHTTTSTQFLGLASSHESLKFSSSQASNIWLYDDNITTISGGLGPPSPPSITDVQALILSDIGRGVMLSGTETDAYLRQTGYMLLEGDTQGYQPLIDDISLASSPISKLRAVETLIDYASCVLQSRASARVSRVDVVHELSKKFGREPGTLYRDLQVISTFTNPAVLDHNDAFEDCCTAAKSVMETVVIRSMDYATRFMRYYFEATTNTTEKVAIMGINDSVEIWEFCAKQGNRIAQQKLADLYMKFTHLKLEIRPLCRPSNVIEGVETPDLREAVSLHWLALSSCI